MASRRETGMTWRIILEIEHAALAAEPIRRAVVGRSEELARGRCRPTSRRPDRSRWPCVRLLSLLGYSQGSILRLAIHLSPKCVAPACRLSTRPQREALVAERVRLLEEIGETIIAPGQMTYGSQAAAASQVFAQQRDLALRDRADHSARPRRRGARAARRRHVRDMPQMRSTRSHPSGSRRSPWAARCIDCQRLAPRER